MIISDEDDAQKIKDPPAAIPTVRYPEPVASRPLGALPDYETSQALASRDANDSQVTLYKPPRRRIFDSRFWRAAFVSLVVYVFLTLVIGVPIIVHKEEEGDQKPPPLNALTYAIWTNKSSPGSSHPGGANVSNPIQAGITPICSNWTMVDYLWDNSDNTPLVLAATENFISPNGQFTLTSNASHSDNPNAIRGAFYTGINPNETVQSAVLSIVMQTSSPAIFNQTSVCLALAENFTDVSLYAPYNLTSPDSIEYNITLLFPQTANPSSVDCFTTILPLFDQRFDSFDGMVTFDRVYIQGPLSRVTVDSIQGNNVLVDTSLEPVTGTFHAQDSLLISTIMAPITANISLYNDPKSRLPTVLDVHTGNGNLTANVTLLAPNVDPPTRPNFIANLRTFSGSLTTSVLHDPRSSPAAINLNVVNDLGPVDALLDSLFQGIFQVSTKQATASVMQGNASGIDPWLPGAERTIAVNSNSTARINGWIGWGNMMLALNSFQQGEALIDTSLANVTLTFLG